MNLKKLTFFLFSFICIIRLSAQTSLTAGDLVFIGFQSGYTATPQPKDRFAFVLLRDVEANTEILLSDNAVKSTNPIRLCNNESTSTWKTTTGLAAGTVVVITESDTNASVGKVTGSIALSQSGDAILAFQKVGADTIPIAGIANVAWLTTCLGVTGSCGGANNNTTCLPEPLSSSTALNLSSDSNNFYFNITALTGTQEEMLAAITNPANWTLNNQGQAWTAGTWSFSVLVSNSTDLNGETYFFDPNPTEGNLKLSGKDFVRITISDALGRVVSESFRGAGNLLNMNGLKEGIYFISVYGMDGRLSQISKILKN